MAKLNPSLIFSMTRELKELHEIGKEMVEYIGSCKIVSWRYPDREITDVDIDVEDELFDTSEKYILLLELIIDRLYLIVNLSVELFNALPEIPKSKSIFKLPKNVTKPLGLSFGTLVTLFWKRLKILTDANDPQFSLESSTSATTSTSYGNSVANSSSQTCLSCETVMTMVKNLIVRIEECTKNLKLESQIVQRRPKIKKDVINLTQYDAMRQWTECIVTDIKKLTFYAKNKTTEHFILLQNYEKLRQENLFHVQKLKQKQNKYFDIEKSNRDSNYKLETISKAKDELSLKYNKLLEDFTKSEEESKKKDEKICQLKTILDEIVLENKNLTKNIKIEFDEQIKSMNAEKQLWTELYSKSKLEIEQLEKNLKLQGDKQTNIENQIEDNFIKVKEKISDETFIIEEENKRLIEELKHLKEQMKAQESEYKNKIDLLQEENVKLQNDILSCKRRELILVKCPDLNGAIEYKKGKQNPMEDMEEQLKSNEVRIQLLQEQNVNLHRVLAKLKIISSKENR